MTTNFQKMNFLLAKFNGYKNATLSNIIYDLFQDEINSIKINAIKQPDNWQELLTYSDLQIKRVQQINKICREILKKLNN
jgi:hypothetical protein